jgi:cytochrome c biogenesis protein ResB
VANKAVFVVFLTLFVVSLTSCAAKESPESIPPSFSNREPEYLKLIEVAGGRHEEFKRKFLVRIIPNFGNKKDI